MSLDALLAEPRYDPRLTSHLSWRDMRRFARAMAPSEPIYGLLHRLHSRRVVRRKEVLETLYALDRLAPELAAARRVCEAGAGHGMAGLFAACLWPHLARVEQVDRRRPASWDRIRELLAPAHPRAKTAVRYREVRVERLRVLPPCDLVFGVHLCGALTDHVAALARAAGVPFAVVPCCESRRELPAGTDPAAVEDVAAVVNAARLARWRGWGYAVEERALPPAVTDRWRVFVGVPPAGTAGADGEPPAGTAGADGEPPAGTAGATGSLPPAGTAGATGSSP